MNSDPHESAAWRAFGMLDADEAASFDEAMRHDPELKKAFLEMESLTAAVAAASIQPVTPRAGQLERLERQLGVHKAKRTNWAAISGWAAAAAVTLFVFIDPKGPQAENVATLPPPSPVTVPLEPSHAAETAEATGVNPPISTEMVEIPQIAAIPPAIGPMDETVKVFSRQDTRRLIQENEVLKEQVRDLQIRDRERFEAVPGTAWPIVMRMSPPGMPAQSNDISFGHEDPPMTAILGDALASAGDGYDEGVGKTGLVAKEPTPSAVPIYDAARDTGTLVVNNLPPNIEGEYYNLWVKPEGDAKLMHVGRLPKSNGRAADSFDFSLGSSGIIPVGFMLTRDLQGTTPSVPTPANTVLQGP
ncbi:MAG: hypothetical protein EOP88_20490 [Verrucomicrobiaceae bacterium]|nr:MAG: hypothetical protein EOP88_20490 [Verrucomicrobiaceae bacterium]